MRKYLPLLAVLGIALGIALILNSDSADEEIVSRGFQSKGITSSSTPVPAFINITELHNLIKRGAVAELTPFNNYIEVTFVDGQKTRLNKEFGLSGIEFLEKFGITVEFMSEHGVTYNVPVDPTGTSGWRSLLAVFGSVLPLLLFLGLVFYMMNRAQGQQNNAMNIGKSLAKRVGKGAKNKIPTVTFQDVAGAEEAKEELQEVVQFLKEPGEFLRLGARIPKGVLMVGPPGCGKTLMARAAAGEAGVPFFSTSGSEFVEMFVGVGASRVRDLFKDAKANAPSIVFIDEVDAVGRRRGAGLGGGHDEREQTLNQILTEMDGFEQGTNVIVFAATNRPDILDPALLRAGRFDRRVVVDLPDKVGREEILQIHVRGKPLHEDVDLKKVAKETPGFSGADLENLVNEAAILAARSKRDSIKLSDLEQSAEKVMAGPERRSYRLSKEDRKIVAVHEAGHALAMYKTPGCDPVNKVTILPRGIALGYTWGLPETDRNLVSKTKFKADLIGLLGGRAAEEIVFDDITTGAANDLERATQIARQMVTRFGMSSLGLSVLGKDTGPVFLGKDLAEQRDYSEETARMIDVEVRDIVQEAREKAGSVIEDNLEVLERIVGALLERETISGEELKGLVEG